MSAAELPGRPTMPDAGVTFEVTCPPAPRGAGAHSHPVTITPSWRLITPHDLPAERIAVALGGACTCVDLADHVLPAVRGYLAHRLRLDVAAVVHAVDDSWRVATQVSRCCDDAGFPTVRDAAAHLRRPRHWAARYATTPDRVTALAAHLLQALVAAGSPLRLDQSRDEPCPARDAAAAAYLREASGLTMLWDAGVHPCLVPDLHADLDADGPAPVADVLRQAYADRWDAPAITRARRDDTWPQWGIRSPGNFVEQPPDPNDTPHARDYHPWA